MTDGSSFMDNSYLRTIHSSNKKYVEGRKELQEKVPAASAGGRSVKHKLYSSDEEEEAGLHGMLLSHLVVVCGSLLFHCWRLVHHRYFRLCLTYIRAPCRHERGGQRRRWEARPPLPPCH
jgi:hypothetical protein